MEEIMSLYSFFLSKNLVPINISENFFSSQEAGYIPQEGKKKSFLLVILDMKKHHKKHMYKLLGKLRP